MPVASTFLLLACSVLASAANAEEFTANLITREILIPQPMLPDCLKRGVLTTSSGTTSSIFGNSVAASTDCVTTLDSGKLLKFDHGLMVLSPAVATGGADASIFLTYNGTFQLSGDVNLQTGELKYEMTSGSFVIVGGTGKYKRATGSGSMTGQTIGNIDQSLPGIGTLNAKGVISY